MEIRGAKLSIAMENLKSVYLEACSSIKPDEDSDLITEYIIKEGSFNNYRKDLESLLKIFLEEKGIVENQRGRIYKNLPCINRSSFEDILRSLWKDIGLSLDDNTICLFINSRNSLVHQCEFYCKTSRSSKKCIALSNRTEEYFFLVNILDKTILKFLGYKGSYYNLQKKKF